MSPIPARVLACAALLLLGKDAWAQYAVLAQSGRPEVLAQRVAVSLSDPPKVWLALRLAGGTEAGALVLAVARDAEVRPADGAWFSALEGATAVRVLAPDGADLPQCPVPGEAWHDTGEAWHEPAATLSAIDRFEDVGAFTAYGEERGFALETSLLAELESVPPESEIVALSFACAASDASGCYVSAHFEVRSQGELVLPLLGSDDGVATTVWAFTGAPLGVPDATTASLSAIAPVTWRAATGQSDYTTARSAFLHDNRETWLLESANAQTFRSGVIFGEERRIPSLLTSYEPGEFDEIEALHQAPEWITRWFVYATPAARELALRPGEQASVWPIHRWAALDATGCASPPKANDPAPDPNGSSGSVCVDCSSEPEPVDSEVVVGCGSTSSGSNEGCTGDTSQSSDSGCSSDTSESAASDSGCSSDTSETQDSDCSGDTSETHDSDCSGDTSESSASDSGCSSDTSESSASDSGCSSDTSESSDSGCSGDTADSGNSGCSGDTADSAAKPSNQRRARARRWKGSPMISVYVACALTLPLRRFRVRRKRRP